MRVTVFGLSGLTNAYVSVLSTTGSLLTSGASRCDDMVFLSLSASWFGQRVASSSRLTSAGSLKVTSFCPHMTTTSWRPALWTYAVTGSAGVGPDRLVTTGAGAVEVEAPWASNATDAAFGITRN